jgi:hypothetical protein
MKSTRNAAAVMERGDENETCKIPDEKRNHLIFWIYCDDLPASRRFTCAR